MCFGSAPKVEPTAPAPRQVNNSEAVAMREASNKERKRLAAAAGMQANIKTSGMGLTDLGETTKKKLLGE